MVPPPQSAPPSDSATGDDADTRPDRTSHTERAAAAERAFQVVAMTNLEVFWVDAEGRVIDANPALCRNTGYSAAELRQLTVFDLNPAITPQDWAEHTRLLRRADPPSLTMQGLRRCKDSRTYPIEYTASHTVTDGADVFCSIARDISAQLQSFEDIALFKTVLDRTNEAIFWLDDKGRFLYANEAGCALLRTPREAVLTKTVGAFNPRYGGEAWPRHWKELKARGHWVFESGVCRGDGSWVDVEISANLLTTQRGDINIAFVRDITDQKQVMEEMKHTLYITRQSQRAARIGHFYFDMVHDIGKSSEVISDIFGFEGEFSGPLSAWMPFIHPDDRERLTRHLMDDVLRDGKSFDIEYRILRANDGTLRWLRGKGEVDRGPDGTEALLIGTAQDVTDHKQAEDQIQATVEALTRSNIELERFAYIASHDLQEPIRNVVAFSQLLEKRYMGRLGEEADEYLGFIISGAKRMQALVLDLLDYSRVTTAGRAFAPVSVERVLDLVRDNLRMALEECAAHLEIAPLPLVSGDEIQLTALFQNLIANALKFRHPEVPPRIQVTARRDGATWCIAVTDNGIGIPPEHQEQIFTIFKRLHTDQSYPGTGIGLAVSKRIVERHGGALTVDSRPGAGSTFTVHLPADPPPSPAPTGTDQD